MFEQSGRQQGKSEAQRIQFYITACRCALYGHQHVVIVVRDWRIARFRFEELAQTLEVKIANPQQLRVHIGEGSIRFKAVEAEPAFGNKGLIFIDKTDWGGHYDRSPHFWNEARKWEELAQSMTGRFSIPQPTTPATSL